MNYKIKHINKDFKVREVYMEPITCDVENAKYTIFELRKDNISTYDAVLIIAGAIGVSSEYISYNGLKDEDGITTQLIAIAGVYKQDINSIIPDLTSGSLILRLIGYSLTPLKIGRLHGNVFGITLRDIDRKYFDKLKRLENESVELTSLNYYDTQRFGIPNSTHNTHIIGEKILSENWDGAVEQFLLSGNSVEEKERLKEVCQKHGSKQAMFQVLDKRKLSFFVSSYMSYQWNERIVDLLSNRFSCDELHSYDNKIQKLSFLSKLTVPSCGNNYYDYSYCKIDDLNNINIVEKKRQILLYTKVFINNLDDDELFAGKLRIDLSFCLQSGSYATMLVKQLMDNI